MTAKHKTTQFNALSLLAAACLLLALPACQSTSHPVAAQSHLGSFIFAYTGGNTYRVDVPDDSSIHWECLVGDEKGRSEREQVDRRTIAKGIYFVSWTESDGTVVSQVLDLNRNHVTSTISLGSKRYFLEGSVTRVSPK